MKKLLTCLLAVAMVIAMAGCDLLSMFSKDETPASTDKELSLGEVSDNKYESEFIGIGYNLPESWRFYTDEEIAELNNYTGNIAGQDYKDLIKNATVVYDMMAASPSQTDNVVVTLEKKPNATINNLNIAASFESSFAMVKSTFENMGYRNITHEVTTVTVNGQVLDCMHISATYAGQTMHQTSIMFKCNGYIATIALTTFDAAGTAPLLANLYLLK